MKTIEINAKPFFDMLKNRETSMWSMFSEMLHEKEEQLVVFLDEDGKEIAHYILPTTQEQLQKDREVFAESFKQRLNAYKN